MKEVLLASTLHDPKGIFLDDLPKAAEAVLSNYSAWIVNTTSTTDQKVNEELLKRGVN
ncbi:hypothetical protein HYW46_05690 [Candidatus Daviesbacteria bacterium]|nr:hypothetical protein [Candidatus Daviesbacteria bacterium]